MQVHEKVGKSRFTLFFQWFVALEGRKVGSLKRRVRSQLARWEMKNCTPLWREAHFQGKMYKAHHSQTTFGSWDVEKVHAVVAQSTFANKKAKDTSRSVRFWKLRCSKSARRCGAKHISKSKVYKTDGPGPLVEVEIFKKAHAVVARSTFPSQKCQKLRGFWALFGSWDVEKKSTPTNLTTLTTLTTLTNLTSWTNFTNFTSLTNLTNLTYTIYFTYSTTLTNLTNFD